MIEVLLVLVTAALVAPVTVSGLAATSSAAPSTPADTSGVTAPGRPQPGTPRQFAPGLDAPGPDALGPGAPVALAAVGPALPAVPAGGRQAASGAEDPGGPGAAATSPVSPRDVAAQAARDRQRAQERAIAPPPPPPTPMAAAGDLELVVPAAPDAGAVVGFHQAGAGSPAVTLTPLGETVDSHVPSFEPVDTDGHDHAVMASRSRGTPFTSAVDIAVEPQTTVLAPVDGVVTTVAQYALYGRFRDVVVVIAPTGESERDVHLFHLEDPVVGEGDEVRAGETPLATVRRLKMPSQIDRFTGDERPHVHLEVRTR